MESNVRELNDLEETENQEWNQVSPMSTSRYLRSIGWQNLYLGDPCAVEAANFTRDLCQQRDVTVEIETMDKVRVQYYYLWKMSEHDSFFMIHI